MNTENTNTNVGSGSPEVINSVAPAAKRGRPRNPAITTVIFTDMDYNKRGKGKPKDGTQYRALTVQRAEASTYVKGTTKIVSETVVTAHTKVKVAVVAVENRPAIVAPVQPEQTQPESAPVGTAVAA